MRAMKIALLQMTGGIDPAANARVLRDAIATAAERGAAILFTPELTNFVDSKADRAAETIADEKDDIVLAAARDAAEAHGVFVALGSLAIDPVGADRWANRSLMIGPDGAILARYDKMHMFDVDLEDGESWHESARYAPGKRAVVVDAAGVKIGLSICYDLRFPDLYRALTDAGAQLVAVPAAFTTSTGRAHWEALLRARGIEAGVFVVAAAQVGEHADGRRTYGHSMVVDPWGEVRLDMRDTPGVEVIDIDLDRIDEVRERVPAIRHRRPIPEPELRP